MRKPAADNVSGTHLRRRPSRILLWPLSVPVAKWKSSATSCSTWNTLEFFRTRRGCSMWNKLEFFRAGRRCSTWNSCSSSFWALIRKSNHQSHAWHCLKNGPMSRLPAAGFLPIISRLSASRASPSRGCLDSSPPLPEVPRPVGTS